MNNIFKLLTIACLSSAVSVSAFAVSDAMEQRDLAGADMTRELPWDGSEMLTIGVPASVRFVQTSGPGKVIVTGS